MLNKLSPAMVEVLLDHYKWRLREASSIDEKLFVSGRLEYYSNIHENKQEKELLKLNQCS